MCHFTWLHSQVCCCTAPTPRCPRHSPRCSNLPTHWHHEKLPKTQQLTYPCFWWEQLFPGQMGCLTIDTLTSVTGNHSLLQYMHVCDVCSQTELVSDCGSFSGFRRFTDAGRVAAPDTEAVGFALGEIEQSKARRLDWDLCVHPLPAVCAGDTLTHRHTDASSTLARDNFSCRSKLTRRRDTVPFPHSTWHLQGLSLQVASSSAPHSS